MLEASFSKSFRGYDVSEVDAYVQSVQDFETESQNSLAKSNQKVADLEAEVARLREIESSLFRALKLAEESQQNFSAKMEKEAKVILDKASKEADAIKKKAETEAQKQALLSENERKQTLAQAGQELKEQERQLRNLQEAQKEIAAQLKQIAEQTLGSISQWNATELVKPVASIDTVAAPAAKRGRKPGVKNKPKSKAKSATKAKVAKSKAVAKPKAVSKPKAVAKPKAVKAEVPAKPKAVPAKRGPKPKVQAAKPAAKRGPKPKITLETVSDEGLPTLNKVLEAYAKSSGPRGKVGEIN
ncbi:DivIVA domain-containing protein [Aquirufa antheringensis]|jgi:cell division initiation protein|uniref:DivIVA domain-containing protein n=1 Tax=Aquirufa antheringensis TaxID=2516559 RepID=A0A4Q9B9A7_9BACT|nr:DivIVA domain-containing protein [Aquirufa antheringensis]MCZ2485816.1 DivIVA domain-containing protein [Aquirufa antheringensis]MCZ2486492.1 DivIVA domain-containing protein [Aquirufa antheringensis]MCZ2488727.1 DivIVA domain-containing protein [Aquirufa antheringensis]TBH71203.1 DivIVA domain-containing protein [Aquirufa antheringensis]